MNQQYVKIIGNYLLYACLCAQFYFLHFHCCYFPLYRQSYLHLTLRMSYYSLHASSASELRMPFCMYSSPKTYNWAHTKLLRQFSKVQSFIIFFLVCYFLTHRVYKSRQNILDTSRNALLALFSAGNFFGTPSENTTDCLAYTVQHC